MPKPARRPSPAVVSVSRDLLAARRATTQRYIGPAAWDILEVLAGDRGSPRRETLVPSLVALMGALIDELRDRPATGYDGKLYQRAAIARLVEVAATSLGRLAPLPVRFRGEAVGSLVAILEMPLQGWCRPECCSAGHTRIAQLGAHGAMLRSLGRIDGEAGAQLSTSLVLDLLTQAGRGRGVPGAELLARSNEACRVHLGPLRAGLEGRHWQVAEICVRALSRPAIADLPAISSQLNHEHWQVRLAAIRGLARHETKTKAKTKAKVIKRLTKLAKRDGHPAVRWHASKLLESCRCCDDSA